MQNIESSADRCSTKDSKTTAASNYPKKSTSVIVEEAFLLPDTQTESESVVSIQRILNPGFDPVSSALQAQCKIQNPKQMFTTPPRLLSPIGLTSPKRPRTSSRRLGCQVEKRNQRERNRVHTVNQAFHALKSYLPNLKTSTKRVSKLKILKSAITYLNSLTDQIDGIISDHIPSPVSTNASSGGSPNYIPTTSSPAISNIFAGTSLSQTAQSDFQPNSALFNNSIPPALSNQNAANFFGLNYQNIASYVANLHN